MTKTQLLESILSKETSVVAAALIDRSRRVQRHPLCGSAPEWPHRCQRQATEQLAACAWDECVDGGFDDNSSD